jgi:hypothetical protein
MAKKDSEKFKSLVATSKTNPVRVSQAARVYVNQGLRNLNLSREQYSKLRNKLTPIVERTIQTERNRTATRGEGIVNRTAVKKEKAAGKKLMGGK